MRLFGEYGPHKLHILIDSGSTLSFVQETTAKKLNCSLTSAKLLLVKVVNGQRLVSSQQVDPFTWTIQGHKFNYSLRLLETEDCDLILGGDWLKSCTPIELDYSNMTFTVTLLGNRVKLQDLTSPAGCKMLTDTTLFNMVHMEDLDDIEEIYLTTNEQVFKTEDPALQELLRSFQHIFEEPVGLPPERGVEHQILLKPGSIPKQQYLYRTSHTHKEEIERIIKELLESGVITNSKSPFASPVILVKKKKRTTLGGCVWITGILMH